MKRPQRRTALAWSKQSKPACVAIAERGKGREAGDEVKEVMGKTGQGLQTFVKTFAFIMNERQNHLKRL